MSLFELIWVDTSLYEFVWFYMILNDFIWFIWFYFGKLEVAGVEVERQGSREMEATVVSVKVKVQYLIFGLILYDFDFILFDKAVGYWGRWGSKAAGWRNGSSIWYYFLESQNINLPPCCSTIATSNSL